MTIEKGLEGLPKGEKKKTAGAEPVKDKDQLALDSRLLLTKFLVDYFGCNVPGQPGGRYQLKDEDRQIIELLGPDLFTIAPSKKSGQNEIICSLYEKQINDHQAQEILRILVGDYALETDLSTLATKEKWQELRRTVKEIPDFFNSLAMGALDHNRCTLHPYLLVMSIYVETRPLAAMAAERIEKNIDWKNFELSYPFGRNEVVDCLNKMIPGTKEIVSVAQKYHLKEILPVQKAFELIRSTYISEWGS